MNLAAGIIKLIGAANGDLLKLAFQELDIIHVKTLEFAGAGQFEIGGVRRLKGFGHFCCLRIRSRWILVFVPWPGEFWKAPGNALKSECQLIFQIDMIQVFVNLNRSILDRKRNN